MDEYLKVYGLQENKNGVYIVRQSDEYRVVIVYGSGFMTDYPIQYFDDSIAYDAIFIHSKTTKIYVKRAYKYIKNLTKNKEIK